MSSELQPRWLHFAHRLIDDLLRNPRTTLPGVRVLEKQYGISRLTVERAISHLEDIGFVSPVRQGTRRKIHFDKLQEVSALQGRLTDCVLFITSVPSDDLNYVYRFISRELGKLCEMERLTLTHLNVSAEPEYLRALLSSIKPRGIVLSGVPGQLIDLVHSLGIPAVCIALRTPHFPSFFVSYRDLLINAFKQAWKAGHRRVSAPTVISFYPSFEKAAKELQRQFPKDLVFSQHYNAPVVNSTSAEDYHAMMHELFRYTPPTCLILYDISHYLCATSYLLKAKLRIPDDVSIILLTQDRLLSEILPPVAHFERYSAHAVEITFLALKEQMEGFPSREQVKLLPVWVPGGSLSSPKFS